MRRIAIASFLVLTAYVCGQTLPEAGIVFEVEHPTLLPGQSTTVTMAAAWPQEYWGQALVHADLLISTGGEGWSDLELIAPMDGPGTFPGDVVSTGVEGVLAGKLNFPATGVPQDPNPIPFWRATYTAPSDPAAPFDIDLRTRTIDYQIYAQRESVHGTSVIDRVVEGSATIRVIPAPAGVLVVGVGLMVVSGRRRSRGLP